MVGPTLFHKLLRVQNKNVDKNKDGEDIPKPELLKSEVSFTFVPNKQFGKLITISPHSLTMLKTTSAEFMVYRSKQ